MVEMVVIPVILAAPLAYIYDKRNGERKQLEPILLRLDRRESLSNGSRIRISSS